MELARIFANSQQKQVERDRREIYSLATKFQKIANQNKHDFASIDESTFVKDIGINKATLLIEFYANNGKLETVVALLKVIDENKDLQKTYKFQINSQIGKKLLDAGYSADVAKVSEIFTDLDQNDIFQKALSQLIDRDFKQIENIIIRLPLRSLSIKNLHQLVDLGLSDIVINNYFKFEYLDEYLAQSLISQRKYKLLADRLSHFSNLSATTAKALINNGHSQQFAIYSNLFSALDADVLDLFISQNGYLYSYETRKLTQLLVHLGIPVFDTLNKLLDDDKLKIALQDLDHLDAQSTSQILKRLGPKYVVDHISQFESFDKESLDGIMSTAIEHNNSSSLLEQLFTKGLDATFLKEYFEKFHREDLLIKNLQFFENLNPRLDVNLVIKKMFIEDSHYRILSLIDSSLEKLIESGLETSELFVEVCSFFKKRSAINSFSEIYANDYELLAIIFVKGQPISVQDPDAITINNCLETLYKICVKDNDFHDSYFIEVFGKLYLKSIHQGVSFDQISILMHSETFLDLIKKRDLNQINWFLDNSKSINNIQDANCVDEIYKRFGSKYLRILEKGILGLRNENREKIVVGLKENLLRLGVEPTQDEQIISDWVVEKILNDEKFFPTISHKIRVSSTNPSKIEKIEAQYGGEPDCFEQLSDFVSIYKTSKDQNRFIKEMERIRSAYHGKFLPDEKFEKLLYYLKAFETDRVYFNNPKYKEYFERKIENLYIQVFDKIHDIENIDEFVDYEILEMSKIALEIHNLSENEPNLADEESVEMFFRIYSNEPKEFAIGPTLMNTQKYSKKFIGIIHKNNKIFKTIDTLPENPKNRFTKNKIMQNHELLNEFEAIFLAFETNKIAITEYLLNLVTESSSHEATFKEWRELINSFNQGNFESANPLHQNLEYTRFKNIIDHPKISGYIKTGTDFNDFLEIFNSSENQIKHFTEHDNFEIECLLEEVKMLKQYIFKLKDVADSQGKELWVIPNLSYGYLPVSIITQELQDNNINVMFGLKVGSTESHNNKQVLNNQLFKNHRTNMVNNQPIVVVIDGTKNIKSDGDLPRYPDSYQGYLNQMITLNDALEFTKVDYSYAGKTVEDLQKLRESHEYKTLYKVFKENHLDSHVVSTPYKFNFWNTAGLDLSLIGDSGRIQASLLNSQIINNQSSTQNSFYFCNVGLLDEQIPNEVKLKYPDFIHTPAAFDDSGRIVKLSFYYDNHGVHYSNALEEKARALAQNEQITLENRSFCYLIECLRQIVNDRFRTEVEIGHTS